MLFCPPPVPLLCELGVYFMAKKIKKTSSPMGLPAMGSMHSVLKSMGMGSRFKKARKVKKRKVSPFPKGVTRDRRNKSGGIDITKLLKVLAKSARR
jgi:hypothetical protein